MTTLVSKKRCFIESTYPIILYYNRFRLYPDQSDYLAIHIKFIRLRPDDEEFDFDEQFDFDGENRGITVRDVPLQRKLLFTEYLYIVPVIGQSAKMAKKNINNSGIIVENNK